MKSYEKVLLNFIKYIIYLWVIFKLFRFYLKQISLFFSEMLALEI